MSGARLASLTSPQVAEMIGGPVLTVALLPIGATEAHGPHAPLGTDTLISEGVCRRAAAALAAGGLARPLIVPTLAYGVTRCAAEFPGTIGISDNTLHGLVVEVCASIVDQGIRHIALVNNHLEPAHVATLRRAVTDLDGRDAARVGLLDISRRSRASRLTAEFQSGSCHAGRYETSLVLADAPELVDRQRLAGLAAVRVDMPARIASGAADFRAMGMPDAYCGAPVEATAEEGEKTYATLTEMLVELVGELVSG